LLRCNPCWIAPRNDLLFLYLLKTTGFVVAMDHRTICAVLLAMTAIAEFFISTLSPSPGAA
jgi:hypothetical protein